MSRIRLISPTTWASHVLRKLDEIAQALNEQRREMLHFMATLQEQVTQLSGTLDGILAGLSVVQNEVGELVTEIANLNANTPPSVDLSPIQAKAQTALDMLSGIQQQASVPAPAGDAGAPTA